MLGLSEAHYNCVKRCAKDCIAEIREEIAAGSKYDHCAARIIKKHHDKVAAIVSKVGFIWICGYLNSRWGNKGEYE